jgi:hypothetical protein
MKKDLKVDFIGIGAARSGTTWLANCLRLHPEICLSEPKEIRYFNRFPIQISANQNIINKNHTKPLSWYLNHFRHCKEHQIRGEFSPIYFADQAAPESIKHYFPNIKLILCLRNPIDRAYSHYWFHRGLSSIRDMTFEEAIQKERIYIEMGLYAMQMKRYLQHFTKDQILILLSDDMKIQPELELKKVLRYLNVSTDINSDILKGNANAPAEVKSTRVKKFLYSGSRVLINLKLSYVLDIMRKMGMHKLITKLNAAALHYPEMNPRTREYLYNVFRDDIEELEMLLNCNLSHWQ